MVQLRARLPLCVRALLTVMRGLPEHAISQVQELRATLCGLLNRCLIEGRPLPPPVRPLLQALLRKAPELCSGHHAAFPGRSQA